MTQRHDAELTLELFVRAVGPGPGSPSEHVLASLDALETQGAIAGYTVTICGKSIPASVDDALTPVGERLADRATTLENWAAHNDRRLVGVFEARTVTSSITGDRYDCRMAPVQGLAEYVGSALRFVAPSGDDERVVTVGDRLAELATGDLTPAEPLFEAVEGDPGVSPGLP